MNYSEYFQNILSRSWIGARRESSPKTIEQSNITNLYLDIAQNDKVILIGKTEKFYFILECFNSDGYLYSNGLFNDNLASLVSGYKNKETITGGKDIESFVYSLMLQDELSKELTINHIQKSKKIQKI
jgi:uncharacterized protein YrrD